MSARSKGRKRALDILYESDIKAVNPLWLVKENITSSDEISLFAIELVEGYGNQGPFIDSLIDKNAKNWDLDRLASVDRNILRIAVYEILQSKKGGVDIAVAIDEAIELAKSFSTDESPQYIHGILSAIARELDGSEASQ
jgi:transcription antitermination protein NusB